MPEQHHSQHTQELLGRAPSWLVSWGTALVFIIVLGLLIGAAKVRYPEVISGRIIITSSNPVSPLYAKKSGRLIEIFAQSGDTVKPNQWLMVIENPAQTQHVNELKEIIEYYDSIVLHEKEILPQIENNQLQLGDLQPFVTQWRLAYSNWANFVNIDIYGRKLEALKRQLLMYHQYYERSWAQRLVLQEQYELAAERYRIDSILEVKGAIAPIALKQLKEEFLNRQFALQGARANLAQLQIQMRDLERNIAETEAEYENTREQNLQAYYTNVAQLRAAIAQWVETHVLVSPIHGILQYQSALTIQSNVQAQAHLLSVEPLEKPNYEARIAVPPMRASRIAIGQRVQGKLDAFPFQEFGMIEGVVCQVNTTAALDINGDVSYWISIKLPDDPLTAFGTSISAYKELYGIGDIITDDLSLLDRLLYQLRMIWGR